MLPPLRRLCRRRMTLASRLMLAVVSDSSAAVVFGGDMSSLISFVLSWPSVYLSLLFCCRMELFAGL